MFHGGVCAHWTTENNTPHTRVSLDFRVIPGGRFISEEGWSPKDNFSNKEGYYSTCRKTEIAGTDGIFLWKRQGELLEPDARCGFPFTNKRLRQGGKSRC